MKNENFNQELKKLEQFDTPSITNVVATYPEDQELCLGLYDPWAANWYTDQSVKCMYPELGRRAGYAVTVVYGPVDANFKRRSFDDVLRAVDASPKPVIVCIKQGFPKEIKNKNGLCGGNMTTAMKALGTVGIISDGPSRDVDEIRPMEVQYMLTGITAGHGAFSVKAVNVPVNICGMDVCPGDVIHMDENGAVKFPNQYIGDVLDKVQRLQKIEQERQEKMRNSSDVEEIIRIMNGFEDNK